MALGAFGFNDDGLPTISAWSGKPGTRSCAGDTVKVALERCDEVASRSGVDPVAMWQWAFIERVSTGLFLLCLGHQAEAAAYPEVSDRLAEVASPRA